MQLEPRQPEWCQWVASPHIWAWGVMSRVPWRKLKAAKLFLEEREHNERPSTRRARAYLASGAAHIRAEAETRHYIHHEYHKAFLPNSQKKVGHLSCISGYTLPSIELSRYIQYMKKVSQLLSPIACGNPCCANSTALTSYASEFRRDRKCNFQLSSSSFSSSAVQFSCPSAVGKAGCIFDRSGQFWMEMRVPSKHHPPLSSKNWGRVDLWNFGIWAAASFVRSPFLQRIIRQAVVAEVRGGPKLVRGYYTTLAISDIRNLNLSLWNQYLD